MTRHKLWDAWVYDSGKWSRIPLGAHKDSEEARKYADAHCPYVSQIVQVAGGFLVTTLDLTPVDECVYTSWPWKVHHA